jgi:DNA-binding transcriptional LysR family regulator
MHWDDLKLFLAVSRQPRLADVARRSGLDPTTISRRLRRLEGDLSMELFERTPRGHILTPEGQDLANRAEAVEQAAAEVASFADAQGPRPSGRVRLGVPEGLGSLLIAPAMTDFARKWPDLGLDLIALSGFVSVPKREADMSILLTRPRTGRLKTRKLGDYSLRLFAHPAYLDRSPVIREICDLTNHDLIGYVDDLIYSAQLRYHDEIAPGLSPRFCSPSIVAQWQMARRGAGIAVLPQFIAGQDPDLVCLLPHQVHIRRAFWLAIHEDVHATARIQATRNFLTELFRRSSALLQVPFTPS